MFARDNDNVKVSTAGFTGAVATAVQAVTDKNAWDHVDFVAIHLYQDAYKGNITKPYIDAFNATRAALPAGKNRCQLR